MGSLLEGIIFIVCGVETVPTSLSSPSYQSRAPLTSLSPCLLESTIWSILCLPTSCSRTSPPWPPNSLHLSTPATIHLIMQKHTHDPHPHPHRAHDISIISRRSCWLCRGRERCKTCGKETMRTVEQRGSRTRRKHTMAAAMFRITALKVLHAQQAVHLLK